MAANSSVDKAFLTRARERKLLSDARVRQVYTELAMRRFAEPDLQAYEVVVEHGWLAVEDALALLDASPQDTIEQVELRASPELEPQSSGDTLDGEEQRASTSRGRASDTERFSSPFSQPAELQADTEMADLAPEDEGYAEIPKLVEPLAPAYAVTDSPEDSVLEMELPPPQPSSGDSLFEEGDSQPVPALDAETDSKGPRIVSERTPSAVYMPFDSVVRPQDPQPLAASADTLDGDSDSGTLSITARDWNKPEGTATDPADLLPAPIFQNRGSKGANVDFASFGEDGRRDEEPDPTEDGTDEATDMSGNMIDSAVGEVMEDADDGYFGPAADLTQTPREVLEESIAPPKPLSGNTLFDSEALKEAAPAPAFAAAEDDSDFAATAAPASEAPTRRPSRPITEVKDDSDVDFGVTLPPGQAGKGKDQGTIYDDSDVSLADLTDETSQITSENKLTTGSKTQFATGEMARPGLQQKTGSKIGVESDITGQEMTLADLRAQMGIGEGVKLAKEGQSALTKLRKIGGMKKRYAVVREIARGGMGKVIEVEDNDLRRSVALKVLRKEMLDRRDLVERFLEEAQITGQLEHPNIVPVHEIGVDGRGNLYFTMKLVEGEDLSSILKRMRKKDPGADKAYPLSRLVDIFIKVCEGVAFAHSKGVIHRDLKPANIMVGRFGEVQIMDWGVAKIVGRKEDTADRVVVSDRQDDDAARTMAGSILGTPSYMSPEQARGEVNYMGPTSDIFSLGVILYELLALKTPWTAQTSAQVLDQVKNFNPDPPSKMEPDRKIPPELEQLAMKCIEKMPHKRVQTAQELIEDLRSWQEGRTLAAVEYSLLQLISKWVSRNKVAVLGVSAVLAALIIGGTLAFKAARQGEIDRAREKIATARPVLTQAEELRNKGEYDEAVRLATGVQSDMRNTLEVLPDDKDAQEIQTQAIIVASQSQTEKKNREDELRQKQRDAEKRKELDEALVVARKHLETAHSNDQDSSVDVATTNESFNNAKNAFIKVQGIDPNEPEARLALAEIGDWLKNFDERRRQDESLKSLRVMVDDAGKKLVSVRALKNDTREQYDAAVKVLIETVSVCDSALSIVVMGKEGESLRNKARGFKAEAALDFARRALAQGNYDVADLMLNTGSGTGMLVKEIAETRATLLKKAEERSKYRTLVDDAEKAVRDSEWVLAQAQLQAAINEARTSPFATDAERTRLSRMLELARLEALRVDEARAKVSSEMLRVLAGYNDLVPLLKDPDYRSRAETQRDALRDRTGQTMLDEAAGADDAVAADLLERAFKLVTDKKVLADITGRLTELKLRLALAQVSDRYVLLPRGSFVVGSNRDGDQNPQRTVEQTQFLFIDKYLVTNEEYKAFVDDGGYTRPELWVEQSHVLLAQFVDSSGKPGPANWARGSFDPSLAKVPVTGVSWYEAAAYAKWAGKRIPTADEWEIAAGAPSTTQPAAAGDYAFGTRDAAPQNGVASAREVGTTEWDQSPLGVRDMGCNVAEWTGSASVDRATVKGAEPGMRPELFFRYARRAKNSVAALADRSFGRGFRCARLFTLQDGKDSGDGSHD
ncbi:MAG: protein kinase [Planctomycetes bacterium]|nr:protein kinase [Planctomycetota bacterium]